MKVHLELDTTSGEAGKRAALDVLDRLFGPSTSSAATPAPAAVSTPAPAGPAPVAAPMNPAAPPAPASVAPSPLPASAPAAPVPPAPPASPASAPAGGEASPGGITRAAFSKAVEEYAKVYKPAGTKARFAQLAQQFNQPGWINTSSIPVDQLDAVMPWFAVQQ